MFLASASPPVRYPNVYGVDMPTRREFVANEKSEVRPGFRVCVAPVASDVRYPAKGLAACPGRAAAFLRGGSRCTATERRPGCNTTAVLETAIRSI